MMARPDAGNGSPWWVRAIYVFGIPAGVAVFLVYFLTQAVWTELAGVRTDLRLHMREQGETRHYLRAICLNTAATETQRVLCDDRVADPRR